MYVIIGINSDIHYFKDQVGNGSSLQDLEDDSLIIYVSPL